MIGSQFLLGILSMVSVLVSVPQTPSEVSAAIYRHPVVGEVTLYSPGVMNRVIAVRKRQGYKVRYDVAGYVAVPNCDQIEEVVTVCVNGKCGKFQVMDCSQSWDVKRHTKGGTQAWAELDYTSARKFGVDHKVPATVYGLRYAVSSKRR